MTRTISAEMATRTNVLSLPTRRDTLLLAIGICATTIASVVVSVTDAPPLAIAFWRSAVGAVATLAIFGSRLLGVLRTADRRALGMAVLAGVCLAANVGAWLTALTMTTVASACALAATQSIWAALIAVLLGHRMPRVAWYGVAIAVVATTLVTGADVNLSTRAVIGDGLALFGAVGGAVYFTIGSVARHRIDNLTYSTLCFTACSLSLLITCLAAGQQLIGYSAETWGKIAIIAIGSQLLGQTLMNMVLRSTSATVLSIGTLGMIPLGGIIAFVWFGQQPPPTAIPGMILMIVGAAIVLRSGSRRPASPA
jgi:drug/metabolite transporter (DMT)-like permease